MSGAVLEFREQSNRYEKENTWHGRAERVVVSWAHPLRTFWLTCLLYDYVHGSPTFTLRCGLGMSQGEVQGVHWRVRNNKIIAKDAKIKELTGQLKPVQKA